MRPAAFAARADAQPLVAAHWYNLGAADYRLGAAVQASAEWHRALRIGLVDAVVMALAERLEVEAVATLDLRHFGAVAIKGAPRLLPRDR